MTVGGDAPSTCTTNSASPTRVAARSTASNRLALSTAPRCPAKSATRVTYDYREMNAESRRIRNLYLVLNQFIWLPTSLIVGVNTLFLLDGGLSNVEAFAGVR